MFTEREKEVLGQYLTWFLAMRSDRIESEQHELLKIIEQEKINRPDAPYIIVTFGNQRYGYFRITNETYLLDKLAEDVIETYEKSKQFAASILIKKYGTAVYSKKIIHILKLLSGGK